MRKTGGGGGGGGFFLSLAVLVTLDVSYNMVDKKVEMGVPV